MKEPSSSPHRRRSASASNAGATRRDAPDSPPGAPGWGPALVPGVGGAEPAWHPRGYLPHFGVAHVVQHVTYHLADSLPSIALASLEDELRSRPPRRQAAGRRKRIPAWLDAGHGSCVLKEPSIAEIVQSSFLHFDGTRYACSPGW